MTSLITFIAGPITINSSMIMLDTAPSFLSCPSVFQTAFATSSNNGSGKY